MAKLKKVVTMTGELYGYRYYCPGCKEDHVAPVPRWKFTGTIENPTFTPSLLLRSGHYSELWKPGDPCWCTYNQSQIEKGEKPCSFSCMICHAVITNGKIFYCGDSTHSLAGQTVDMVELPSGLPNNQSSKKKGRESGPRKKAKIRKK